jgi:hypothetical protein
MVHEPPHGLAVVAVEKRQQVPGNAVRRELRQIHIPLAHVINGHGVAGIHFVIILSVVLVVRSFVLDRFRQTA